MKQRNEALCEFPIELRNSSDNLIPEYLKSLDDGYLANWSELIKDHLRGKLHLHIHIHVLVLSDSHSQYFCARFGGLNHDIEFTDSFYVEWTFPKDTELPSAMNNPYNDEQDLMLVGCIQTVQYPQPVSVVSAFTMIRLEALNNGLCRPGNALYISPVTGLFKFLDRARDRECLQLGLLFPVCKNQLPDEVIEARSKMVNNFASDNSKSDWWRDPHCVQDAFSGLRIRLSNSGISVFRQERTDFIVQISDLLIGPLNLGPDTI